MSAPAKYLLTLARIMDYVEDGKRCLIEGEELLNARHIISCGTTCRTDTTVEVLALCLQTSNLNEKPHRITGTFSGIQLNKDQSFKISCTCKAGLSGKCKHCIAVLLYLNRSPLHELEKLSCTDISQKWGIIKHDKKHLYEPVPLVELCHINESDNYSCPENQLDLDKQNEIRNILIAAAPNSALACHIKGRSQDPYLKAPFTNIHLPEIDNSTNYVCEDKDNVSILLNHAVSNPMSVFENCNIEEHELFNNLQVKEQEFYYKEVVVSLDESISISKFTTGQSECKRWKIERRKRITGSTCYSFFTYNVRSSDNENELWNKKLEKHFNSFNFKGNDNTKFGLENEPHAIQRYEEVTSYVVTSYGLIVNPNIPWLAFSPDGIIFQDKNPSLLLEVKCPTLGKSATILEVSKKLAYLKDIDGEYQLNKRHKYYGQVQMGMALLNLNQTHLVCFSKFDSSILIVDVLRDDDFIHSLFKKLKFVYFKYMLPALC